MALNVDPSWLIDSFEYFEFIKNDTMQKPIYKSSEIIENVRIDRNVVFSRDSKETKVLADGVIFCFASDTTPFVEFKEQSKVKYDGRDRIIKKVIPNYEPDSKVLWSYELEVL